MATIASNGTGGGTHDTGASWSGGIAPATTDVSNVVASDTITVDAGHLKGTGGGWLVDDGGILEQDGGITTQPGVEDLVVAGGGTFRHSGGGTGAAIVNYAASSHRVDSVSTSSVKRASFKGASSTLTINFTTSGSIGQGIVQIDYGDLQYIGDASTPAFAPRPGFAGNIVFITNSLLDNCGTIDIADSLAGATTFQVNNNNATNCLDDFITMSQPPATLTTGTREIIGNYADQTIVTGGSTQDYGGFTISGNVLLGTVFIADTPQPAAFSGNLIVKSTQANHTVPASPLNNYFLQDGTVSNPHFLSFGDKAGTFVYDGNIFETADSTANGDGILLPGGAAAKTVTVVRNVVLPNASGGISCTLVSALGSTSLTFSADHNTFKTASGAVGIVGGETESGVADMCTSVRSNIGWHTSATGEIVAGSGAATPVDGYFTVADFNCGYDTTGDQIFTDNYGQPDAKFGTAPGANDVNVDPQFVDATRDLAAWDASLGGAGTIANALAELAKMNTATWDTNYTPAALVTWVKAGFAPQNASLQDAGHDSVTIGAVEFVAPASETSDTAVATDSLQARTDYTAAQTATAVASDTQTVRTDFTVSQSEIAAATDSRAIVWTATVQPAETVVASDLFEGTHTQAGGAEFVNDTLSGEADGTNLSAHTGETGATWTLLAGSAILLLASGRGYVTNSTFYKASGVPASPEYSVSLDAIGVSATTGRAVGPIGRMVDASNCYYAWAYMGVGLEMFKRVSGTITQIGSFATTVDENYSKRLRLELLDGAKKLFEDEVERISSADNTLTAAGFAGVRGTSASTATVGIHFDNVTATDASAAVTGSVSESVVAGDALAAAWTATTDRSDTAVATDVFAGVHTPAGATQGATADTAAAGDAFEPTHTVVAVRADVAAASDAFATTWSITATQADQATAGDAFSATLSGTNTGTTSDIVSAGDSFGPRADFGVSVADVTTAGDALATTWTAGAQRSDTATAGDSTVAAWTATVGLDNAAIATDVLSVRSDSTVERADAAVAGDSFTASQSGVPEGATSDAATSGDSFTARTDFTSGHGSGAVASATFDVLLVSGREVSEGVVVGDLATVAATLTVTRSDQAVAGDAWSATSGTTGTLSATLRITYWMEADSLTATYALDGSLGVSHG